MNNIKSICIILLLLHIFQYCLAQENKYELSKPLELKLAGVNKVLQMSNGNTLLFHFEPSRAISVRVFDPARKEIANNEEICHYLDVYLIKEARFKGLFEIGGEAVMFFDQPNLIGRHRLVRLRFSGSNGKLTDETSVAESKSNEKRIRFYVMKNIHQDNYAILFSMIENLRRNADLNVEYFGNKHESVRTVHLEVDHSGFDYVDVTGAEYLDSGVIITLSSSKIIQNGTISHGNTYDPAGYVNGASASNVSHTSNNINTLGTRKPSMNFTDPKSDNYDEFDPTPTRYNHFVSVFAIPNSPSPIKTKMVDASPDIYPYHTFMTHNDFSGATNLLLLSYKDAFIMYGLERLPAALTNNVFLKLDDQDQKVNINVIKNELANKYLKEKTDTGKIFLGAPVAFFTNEYGLSTIVSESFARYANFETPSRPNLFETWLGDIAITRFDDDGKEISGIVLSRAQYYKSYQHYYYAGNLAAKWHDQLLMDDLPEEIYNRQFLSLNTYNKGKDCFIVFNDADWNFNLNPGHHCDSVFTFENTNAVYYTINGKKETIRNYVFGAPLKGEYKCSFIEGADFDDRTGVYAALIQYKKGDNISLCMAWAHL